MKIIIALLMMISFGVSAQTLDTAKRKRPARVDSIRTQRQALMKNSVKTFIEQNKFYKSSHKDEKGRLVVKLNKNKIEGNRKKGKKVKKKNK